MRTRLHKFLAHCGIASRRKAEVMMAEGRVSVNGRIVSEPGTQIDPERDKIAVDGKPVRQERKLYLVLHKPRGYVTTSSDERGRKTVLDLIEGISERIYPVGRLDRDSEGLLVLSNDGDLALYLTHPSCEVAKTYRATIEGFIPDETLDLIRQGVRVGARKVIPRRITVLTRNQRLSRVEIEVGEGLNREVRRIFAAVGQEVRKLVRTRIGPLTLEGLPRGRARFLTKKELTALQAGMEKTSLDEERENIPARHSPVRRGAPPKGFRKATPRPPAKRFPVSKTRKTPAKKVVRKRGRQ
ncbi:MAG: rRNA pseudouridine synthase [Planctomycetes bacterium]|nr:rRNA pseudouridine synthase [Planctomycetota bacterium]